MDALGYVVENSWLGSVLIQQAKQADISVKDDAKTISIVPKAESMQLTIESDGQQQLINSKLLVVADGADSSWPKTRYFSAA